MHNPQKSTNFVPKCDVKGAFWQPTVDISVVEESIISDNDIPDSYEFEKPLPDTDTFKMFEDKYKAKNKDNLFSTSKEKLKDCIIKKISEIYLKEQAKILNKLSINDNKWNIWNILMFKYNK